LLSVAAPEINPVLQARFAHEAEVVQFAFDPSGKNLLSASADGTVKLWTLPDLRLVADWPGHREVASGIVWVDGFVATTLEGSLDRYAAQVAPVTAGKGPAAAKQATVATGTMSMAEEKEQSGPQPVVLPVTIKGRIERRWGRRRIPVRSKSRSGVDHRGHGGSEQVPIGFQNRGGH